MTPKQAKLLTYIARYQARNHGASPSLSEMRYALGIRSRANVIPMLDRLQKQGRIHRRYGAHRSITITTNEERAGGMIWGCVSCLTHKIGGRTTFATREFATLTVSNEQPECRTCKALMTRLEFRPWRNLEARPTTAPSIGQHEHSPSP